MKSRDFLYNLFIDAKLIGVFFAMLFFIALLPLWMVGLLLYELGKFLYYSFTGRERTDHDSLNISPKSAEEYVKYITERMPEVNVESKQDGKDIVYIFTSNIPRSLKVTLTDMRDHEIIFIAIEKAACRSGNSDDMPDLTPYMDIAISALGGKWQERRSLLIGKEICFQAENGGWHCINKTSSPLDHWVDRRSM